MTSKAPENEEEDLGDRFVSENKEKELDGNAHVTGSWSVEELRVEHLSSKDVDAVDWVVVEFSVRSLCFRSRLLDPAPFVEEKPESVVSEKGAV